MKQRFNPGEGQQNSHKLIFILKENNEKSDGIRTINYTVKNDSAKRVKLEFSSSMKYDFYITDENGNEVYRDSKGKSYLQVLQYIDLGSGEAETFKLKLPELDPGEYTLTAKLAAKGYGNKGSSIEISVK
ncbi:hypothetical protein JNUCC1_01113 [Lentibacillus sp. JNUCC-1]|uniref:BsuPI-related putative proteinase inhibitor n=1 Tax=Lentibacillus sp. JNUCC-1 TaxID=2654513 RepID=UPI0012E76A52|nr:BsuPI-related putative proteinase inhibitor [Lentibacillus sp. JNUCC-1]MUV37307.1 hypothetical protein [Lentibacillus sp. JNUCC-1]